MADETIYEEMKKAGVSRRSFLKFCGLMAGAMGLNAASTDSRPVGCPPAWSKPDPQTVKRSPRRLQTKPRLPVIWLEFQDCAGCSEALTRSQSPTLVNLVLNSITVEYHETLSAAAGFQAEGAKQAAMKKYAGQYILVVEGSISPKDDGIYCTIGGRSSLDLLKRLPPGRRRSSPPATAPRSAVCRRPTPTPPGRSECLRSSRISRWSIFPAARPSRKSSPAPWLNSWSSARLPELDNLHRPKTFYGVTIHDRCLRRPFYEAGKFADSFDDEGARKGYCLYKLGCKGPTTYNSCATMKWSGGLSFPIQSGHPCLGCSEPNFWDGGGFYQGQSAPLEPAGSDHRRGRGSCRGGAGGWHGSGQQGHQKRQSVSDEGERRIGGFHELDRYSCICARPILPGSPPGLHRRDVLPAGAGGLLGLEAGPGSGPRQQSRRGGQSLSSKASSSGLSSPG